MSTPHSLRLPPATQETTHLWSYPDSPWDAERNTDEFVAALDAYATAGLNAVTVGVQGGSPCGNNPSDGHYPCRDMYQRDSSGFDASGGLRAPFFSRLQRIVEAADRLGMAILLQLFYPDEAFKVFAGNDASVQAAADNTVDWLLAGGYTNVVLDVCNECDLCRIAPAACPQQRYQLRSLHWQGGKDHPVKDGLLGELIARMRRRAAAGGASYLMSSSYLGGEVVLDNELQHLDYVNLHANNLWGWRDGNLARMADAVRGLRSWNARPMPIVFTEDDGLCDHDGVMNWGRAEQIMKDRRSTGPQGVACFFHFDDCKPEDGTKCAFGQAVAARASWGIFLGCCGFSTCPSGAHKYDSGMGFQCPPVNWSPTSSQTKREFFETLRDATGGVSFPSPPPPPPPPPPSPPAPPAGPPPPPCLSADLYPNCVVICDLVDIRAGCDDEASDAARAALPLMRSDGGGGDGSDEGSDGSDEGGDGAPCGWCADTMMGADCNDRYFVDPWMLQGNGVLGVRRCEEHTDGSCRAAPDSIRCGRLEPPPAPPVPLLPLLPMLPPWPSEPTISSSDLGALFGANNVIRAGIAVGEDTATRISVAAPSPPVYSSRDESRDTAATTGPAHVSTGVVWRHDDAVEADAREAEAQDAGRLALEPMESTPNPFASTPNMMLAGFGAAAAVVLLMAIYRCCVSLLRRLVRCMRCVCWCCFRAPGGRQQRFEGVPLKEVQAPELS